MPEAQTGSEVMTGPFDTGPWAGLRLIAPAEGGHRSEVWRARLDGRSVSIRRSRRHPASLDWELDLLARLAADGFWHDLSNLGTVVLAPDQQARAERLSNAWEAINAWVAEPSYGRRRLEALDQA